MPSVSTSPGGGAPDNVDPTGTVGTPVITNLSFALDVTGISEDNVTVELLSSGGTQLVTSGDLGTTRTYTINHSESADGTYNYTVRLTDATGNTTDYALNGVVLVSPLTVNSSVSPETFNNDQLFVFNSSGTITLSREATVGLLMVGGGGGGGTNSDTRGGGGGAGGLIHIGDWVAPAGTYTITIGDGGDTSNTTVGGVTLTDKGGNTTLIGGNITLTALGGGGGQESDNSSDNNLPGDGGSGGGGWYYDSASQKTNGLTTQPVNTFDGVNTYGNTGFGNNGGSPVSHDGVGPWPGGGGGGAGAVGGDGSGSTGGNGGDGLNYSTTFGTNHGDTNYPGWFAGGGSSDAYETAPYTGSSGTPGKGGGGTGNLTASAVVASAQSNTGGGGGAGGAGGSGIVIVRV